MLKVDTSQCDRSPRRTTARRCCLLPESRGRSPPIVAFPRVSPGQLCDWLLLGNQLWEWEDRSGSSTTGEKPAPAGSFAANSRRCRPSGCFVALSRSSNSSAGRFLRPRADDHHGRTLRQSAIYGAPAGELHRAAAKAVVNARRRQQSAIGGLSWHDRTACLKRRKLVSNFKPGKLVLRPPMIVGVRRDCPGQLAPIAQDFLLHRCTVPLIPASQLERVAPMELWR